eukprot:scaffold202_cov180-Amphora_coffeaeformis.AAC.2
MLINTSSGATRSGSSFLVWQAVSWLLGLLDLPVLLLALLASLLDVRLGNSGFGDVKTSDHVVESLLDAIRHEDPARLDEKTQLNKVTITEDSGNSMWSRLVDFGGGIKTCRGSFRSPLAQYFPRESQMAHFTLIGPSKSSCNDKEEGGSVYVIMLPGFGEAFDFPRNIMARYLAARYGWTSIILTAPYTSVRKPDGKLFCMFESSSDIVLMAQGMVQEAAALVRHYLDRKNSEKKNLVCISGFSLGAGIGCAACALAMLSGNLDASRLAYVSFAPQGDAAAFINNGSLAATAVNWEAFREHEYQTTEQIQQKVLLSFQKFQRGLYVALSKLENDQGNLRKSIGAVRSITMAHDRIVPPKYLHTFRKAMCRLSKDPSKNVVEKWMPGGHVFGFFLRPYYELKNIVEGVDQLQMT